MHKPMAQGDQLSTFLKTEDQYLTGPKLRARLGISAVTLWRWRHDPRLGFPQPRVIKGRNYFLLSDVCHWLERQPKTA